jgi:single-stranded-DNA-specific exonuclease
MVAGPAERWHAPDPVADSRRPGIQSEVSDLADIGAALRAAAVVVPHTDADGLASGALALRARGEDAQAAVLLDRGEVPWGRDFGGSVALLDWGVRPSAPPGVIVDHHAPEGDPGPQTLVLSGYGAVPERSTAALVRSALLEQPAWIAAVGAVGDLGDAGFALPECAGAPKTAVRKLVPLVNAPRRLPDGPVRTALALLVEHDDPKSALADPRVAELEDAKRAWRAGFDAAVRTAPRVGTSVAALVFSSPFQIHPLVATTWARRLAPRVVLAANAGYLPGRVNFAVRGGPPDSDLRRLLREALPSQGGEYAHGHDRATGGSLDPEAFERLLSALGVP